MDYKYQDLMDSKGISIPCPSKDCREVEKEAFRWGYSPVEHEFNFLPNFIFDEKKSGSPRRFNSEDDLKNCSLCSISLFDNVESAKEVYNSPKRYMVKLRDASRYTHILKGYLKKELGVATNEAPHFEFFEYKGVELKNHFEIFEEL